MPSLLSSLAARALVLGSVLLASCASSTDTTERELRARLEGQQALYLGCAAACPANRVCGGEALSVLTRDLAKAPLVIEAFARGGGEVNDQRYYFVDERGAGTMYYARSSDVSPCDDCGWYRRTFSHLALETVAPAGDFSRPTTPTGRVTLVSSIDRADYSTGPAGCE